MDKFNQSIQIFKLHKTTNFVYRKKRLFKKGKKAFKYIPTQVQQVSFLKLYPVGDTMTLEIQKPTKTEYLQFFCNKNGVITIKEKQLFSYPEIVLLQILLAEIDFDNQEKTRLPTLYYDAKPKYFGIVDTIRFYDNQIKDRYIGATFDLKKDTTISAGNVFQTDLNIQGRVLNRIGEVRNMHENKLQLYCTKEKYPIKITGKLGFYHCTPAYRTGRNWEIELTLIQPPTKQ